MPFFQASPHFRYYILLHVNDKIFQRLARNNDKNNFSSTNDNSNSNDRDKK